MAGALRTTEPCCAGTILRPSGQANEAHLQFVEDTGQQFGLVHTEIALGFIGKHGQRVDGVFGELAVNDALAGMNAKHSAMYEADIKGGRPSIAPEKLMRAMLLQVLYSNDTHQSTTDDESRLYRKSNAAPALPSYLGHVLTDNRHGLVVNVRASQSNGTAEREGAADMLRELGNAGKRVTVAADKAYDTKGFVKACRDMNVTPHVAQDTARNGGSAIDSRTTRHAGYAISQRKRKCIEQCFGWGKVIGPIRQVMVRGLDKVDQLLTLTMAAYNLTRLRSLAQLHPESVR